MKYQYIRAFIVLLAGLIALVLNMKMGKDVNASLMIVLVVIVIFYVIATLVIEILQKSFEWEDDKENNSELEESSLDDEEEIEITTQENVFDEDE
ncbi:MAG: hypothetical protein Q4D51_13290 [Eubacteriales bacterium]|nr:hypothetical protein [Eubacteriales bacterium]